MEEKTKKNDPQSADAGTGVVEGSWVSPEVAAAQDGEQVEMGKDLDENDPNKN